jgi:hypothetical protein
MAAVIGLKFETMFMVLNLKVTADISTLPSPLFDFVPQPGMVPYLFLGNSLQWYMASQMCWKKAR